MTPRYTVRIRNPTEPHTFALRLNARGSRGRTLCETAIGEAEGQVAHTGLGGAGKQSTGSHDRTAAAKI